MRDISPTIPTINDLHRPASMLSVTNGRQTIGFLISRGKLGVEAFSIDEESIGLFKDVPTAATACWKHAHHQPVETKS
jgi:hypothetical protein